MRLLTITFMALLAAEVSAQTPRPPQTMTTFLQEQYATLKRNLMGSAEKMPAEHFSFRPAPEVRTYAELFAHTIDTQYFYCNAVQGRAESSRRKKSREKRHRQGRHRADGQGRICLL